MNTLKDQVDEYQKLLERGVIQKAYRGLIQFMGYLRADLTKKHPEYAAGNIYQGYMDMTYFPLFPPELKKRRLKIAIVLIHEKLIFEIWLSGVNKQVQTRYRQLIKESEWTKYRMPASLQGSDSIIENTLVENPDFNNTEELAGQIENETVLFIQEIEKFLVKH
jgi:hypothetical protein